jgi:glycosyltransferase involved in cell wall biosynthesis
MKEKLKRSMVNLPDWWFAYTDFTRDILLKEGYSNEHITLVQNAVDTTGLHDHLASITLEDQQELRSQLGIDGGSVGIYCGSLYDLKRIDFLIQASVKIRSKVEGFHLIILGDGVDRSIAEKAAKKHAWIHFVGAKYAREQALYMSLGDVALMPGLVGLGIVDSFLFGMPLFTTDCGVHSPEVAYLRQGRNGFMTENSLDAYTNQVVEVLCDPDKLRELSNSCERDSHQYTIENMAHNFAEGIRQALQAGGK